ncbi:MAG: N-acetyltransferase [Candidatus Viridilinea halotolerans]|uniref:N-acetyltransferase n=1 Tax=Candidatus Viridilinea halotolerans TaxID=2491704 RepID=A0A426TRJ5_9CHLR|nr:MAG: N-acetyltransferase [Candidatus Viridilinea halotolerans]
MPNVHNALGQPIGPPVPAWTPPPVPPHMPLAGQYCALEPLDPDRHAHDLYAAISADREGRMWTYLPYGPFPTFAAYRAWLDQPCADPDALFYAIRIRATGRAAGVVCYIRITPQAGSLEVAHAALAPELQRTPAATEAQFLLMQHAFALGYRRYEWRCNALNAPSRAAAQRLGLSFEGVFRQALVVKGHNRDTAWYAAIDAEWPQLHAAFRRWLDPANFDATGNQIIRLATLTEPLLYRKG